MTVGYGPVQDIGSHGPLSPVSKANNPFDTPEGSPSTSRMPAFNLDDDSANHHGHMTDQADGNYDQGHDEPLQPFDGKRRLRRSQVIRKVNSGFEILRPGTLGPPRQSIDITELSGDPGGGIKRQSRKLQKKPRPNSYSIEEP